MTHHFPSSPRAGLGSSPARALAVALGAALFVLPRPASTAATVSVPLECSRGPSGQHYDTAVQAPKSVEEGGTVTIRLDGTSSGKISEFGLRHIRSMISDFTVPAGSTFVPGSARIVPDTGTANVRAGATVAFVDGVIRLSLPAKVESGSSFTPPAIEYQLKATASAGQSLAIGFAQYRVTASAMVIGDLSVVCDPTPKPFPMATTTIVKPAAPAP